jgi:hypothetical protein
MTSAGRVYWQLSLKSLFVNQNFITLFLSFYFNSLFLVFSANANIIFANPQPVRSVAPGVREPQVGNHCVRCIVWYSTLLLKQHTFPQEGRKDVEGCALSCHLPRLQTVLGARGSVVVMVVVVGFETRWGEFLNLPNPSDRTRPWGLRSL